MLNVILGLESRPKPGNWPSSLRGREETQSQVQYIQTLWLRCHGTVQFHTVIMVLPALKGVYQTYHRETVLAVELEYRHGNNVLLRLTSVWIVLVMASETKIKPFQTDPKLLFQPNVGLELLVVLVKMA